MKPLLETRGVCKRFGDARVVERVSLQFRRGAIHAIVGPNGAGKSTLLDLLCGALTPDSGQILWEEGRDITRLPLYRRARLGIGRTWQQVSLFPNFTARESCRLAARVAQSERGRASRRAAARMDSDAGAETALERCGLRERGDALAATLSHGEQRQLEIAMALAARPRLLLLDEPLAGMGHRESARIVALLRELAAECALALVEHDVEAVFALADTLTVMDDGAALKSGAPAAVRADPAVQRAYLGATPSRPDQKTDP